LREFVFQPPGKSLAGPPSAEDLQTWKKALFDYDNHGGLLVEENDSMARMLALFYARYGAGLVGQLTHLYWSDGLLRRPSAGADVVRIEMSQLPLVVTNINNQRMCLTISIYHRGVT
jgi:hypothetical protein